MSLKKTATALYKMKMNNRALKKGYGQAMAIGYPE